MSSEKRVETNLPRTDLEHHRRTLLNLLFYIVSSDTQKLV